MKIAAWNLNHRTLEKPIPSGVLDVVGSLAPDVLVLNEYVDGERRGEFKAALAGLGLSHITVSKRLAGHNQVLMASRAPHLSGTLTAPPIDSHAETNFHSVHVGAVEIVGVRVPAYEEREFTERYWRELHSGMRSARRRPVLLIGDMNGDPENPRSPGGMRMAKWREEGWVIPVAEGAWSFPVRGGAGGSRIDHVIANEWVGAIEASYVTRVGEHELAGGPAGVALSDHAALVAELRAFDGAGRRTEGPRGELIVHVAAEGGGLDLVGCRKGEGWVYRGAVRDWTPELLDEEWAEHESASVATWKEALELLDRYPWHQLSPTFVHPEFRQAIFDAVVERYRDGSAHSTLGKWKLACGMARE